MARTLPVLWTWTPFRQTDDFYNFMAVINPRMFLDMIMRAMSDAVTTKTKPATSSHNSYKQLTRQQNWLFDLLIY